MKFLRRFIILLLVIGIGTFIFTYHAPAQVMGTASQALKMYYSLKKADEVNSQKITITRDGQDIEIERERKPYMTSQMHLMVDVRDTARIFGCRADVCDNKTGCRFLFGTQEVRMALGENTYTVDGETAEAVDPLLMRDSQIYVRLDLLAETFGMTYRWETDANQALIVCGTASGDGESEKAGGREAASGESEMADGKEHGTNEIENGSTESLPDVYDMRKEHRVTPVRSQGNLGTCWAFAALGALESSLMPEKEYVFSVDHMSFMSGFNMTQLDGGDFNMALAYLAAWKGPVCEIDDPYGDGVSDDSLEAVVHLQEAVNIARKDYASIKQQILDCGGVQSSFYSDMETAVSNSSYYNSKNCAYYYPGKNFANHDVVIVGWDDHYPRENFNSYPENDGAFICRNSWGTAFGDAGYFYISYEDTNIGVNNIVYTRVDPADNYKNIYQSDLLGWIGTIGYGSDTAWFSNVYEAKNNEALRAVAFYTTDSDNYYDIFVVRDFTDSSSFGTMEYVQSGFIGQAGYYTCDLEQSVDLDAGKKFAVIVCLTTTDSERPVAIEYETGDLTSSVNIDDGEGYLSYNGLAWERMEDVYACNVCLKAFTD